MMRGLRPLFGLAVVIVVTGAHAQEMIEVPTPPPAPPEPAVVAAPLPPVDRFWLAVEAGASYRSVFSSDFAGASVGLTLGAQTQRLSIGGRLRGDFGLVGGLTYENVSVGPYLMGRLSRRVRLGGGVSVGMLAYQRVSITRYDDPTVWAPTFGLDADLTFDLVHTRREGALYLLGRAGLDLIGSNGGDVFDVTPSMTVSAGVGYRY